MAVGRFAPSPSGALHVGNLRTALLAWLFARSTGSAFLLRVEDLDPVSSRVEHEHSQLADLAALGIEWDGPVVRQSDRRDAHEEAIATLDAAGLLYPCFCSRREVAEAVQAPHEELPDGAYPGTCRQLTRAERSEREAAGRPPSLRLRAGAARVAVHDELAGAHTGVVDDVVVRRGDGTPSYNLAVVVDDGAQGVEEVVRGDDLLASTPRQVHLAHLLDVAPPRYAHVPLVLGPDGRRLAKRHGAISLAQLAGRGVSAQHVLDELATSLGLAAPRERVQAAKLVERFDPTAVPRQPWRTDPASWGAS